MNLNPRTLNESNGFLVPVLTGSPKEMGAQYGALMGEYMQNAYNILIEPGRKKGRISNERCERKSSANNTNLGVGNGYIE